VEALATKPAAGCESHARDRLDEDMISLMLHY
jgi:hypothetical protein